MADFDYSDELASSGVPLGRSVATFMNWCGAGLSVALVAGLGLWGYQLLVRDVTGVPVVRALEGPMRIAPENPGGDSARFQGLAVNEIAAEGIASPVPDQIVLAPEAPDLGEQDQAMAALLPDQPEVPVPTMTREVSATDLAVAAALAESPLLTRAVASDEDADLLVRASLGADVLPKDVAGVTRSPRPAPRPGVRVASAAALAPADLDTVELSVDADPANIAAGTRLVQLGAFPTETEAEAEWERVSLRFEEFMAGKKRVIQPAEAGGREFYRLRVLGFDDLSASRRFCAALVAGETSCIPVAWR